MNTKTIKITLIFTAFCIALSVSLLSFDSNAETWMAKHYKKNPMSLEELKSNWGEPANTVTLANGVQKMIFGPKDKETGYTYFLVKDSQVIDRGITSSLEKTVAKQSSGPVAKGWMANYYKKNPMTIEALKAKYGTPISNHDYANGIKKLTFGPKDPEIGYVYFLVKDGMVVDQKVTGN